MWMTGFAKQASGYLIWPNWRLKRGCTSRNKNSGTQICKMKHLDAQSGKVRAELRLYWGFAKLKAEEGLYYVAETKVAGSLCKTEHLGAWSDKIRGRGRVILRAVRFSFAKPSTWVLGLVKLKAEDCCNGQLTTPYSIIPSFVPVWYHPWWCHINPSFINIKNNLHICTP